MLKKVELQVMGPEPKTCPETKLDWINLLNWFNYFYTVADGKGWIKEFMEDENYDEEYVAAYQRNPDHKTSFHFCVYARLINKCIDIPDDLRKELEDHINAMIDNDPPEVRATLTKAQEKIWGVVGMIEEVVDIFLGNYKFFEPEVYKLLQEQNVKAPQARAILKFYLSILEEVAAAAKGKIEGYDHLSKPQRRAYERFVSAIVGDLDRYIAKEKASRKPRTAKKIKRKRAKK